MVLNEIIAVPLCGFGNRLKFLASISGIAKKLKIKTVKILWRPSIDCNIAHEDVFRNIRSMSFINENEFPEKSKIMYYGYVHMNEILATLDEDLTVEGNTSKTTLLIEGGHECKHPKTNLVEFLKLKNKFYNSISWTTKVEKAIKEIYGDGEFPKVGVHYRHVNKETDEADVKANELVNFSSNSPFIVFEDLLRQFKQPFFFISNSFYHKNYIQDNVPKGVVVNIQDSNNRSSRDSMFLSVVEFVLLTRCEVIVGSYFSSFSDEASYFKNSMKLMPIAPNIIANKNDLEVFKTQYHSVLKPVNVDNYLLLHPNTNDLITYF